MLGVDGKMSAIDGHFLEFCGQGIAMPTNLHRKSRFCKLSVLARQTDNRLWDLTNCPALRYKATHATHIQHCLHAAGLSAGMVELVDAADSKSADRKVLRVQVSLPVPRKSKG